MTTGYNKPLPRPVSHELTKPFWEAAKRHELVMPRCRKCGHFFFYPREECPSCLSRDLEWSSVTGKGRLHSYTIVRQPANPAFRADAPHVYALVQLDEGPRMVTNIVECEFDDLQVEMPVEAVYDDVTPEWTLVKFKPASGAG